MTAGRRKGDPWAPESRAKHRESRKRNRAELKAKVAAAVGAVMNGRDAAQCQGISLDGARCGHRVAKHRGDFCPNHRKGNP